LFVKHLHLSWYLNIAYIPPDSRMTCPIDLVIFGDCNSHASAAPEDVKSSQVKYSFIA